MFLFEKKSQRNSTEQQSLKRLQNDMLDEKLQEFDDDTCEINFKMVSSILQIVMIPKIGPYGFKKFFFFLDFRINYPYSPPKIQAESDIPHPNIDRRTQTFYLQLLEPQNWRPIYGLTDIIKAMKQTLIYVDFTHIPNEATCLLMAQKILQQNQTLQEIDFELIHFEISDNFKINFELNANEFSNEEYNYSRISQEPATINLLKTQRHTQNDRIIFNNIKS
ncbi:unnamed protein product (macronuclear) [Paramecium tetraurelia]|uniref:UBC core domain-containing protein n=1 Tax=Paramecium tetraurelia TaxID=5888 RepID=A0BJ41_PARTE|nr:uncharacterized protein GSPATT00004931001 [Paramecium tetraurelia]CAK58558.1 unnamed protein product [Paramecium tetraurelia]|eukprot:XP_001425956.1 hypothetical protein (macronuclear) [Paramecium tetraurelia strain d4-2]